MWAEVRTGRREGRGVTAATSGVHGDGKLGARACARAHRKHGVHACHLGRVETQQLVERGRALCRVEGRAYEMRAGRQKGVLVRLRLKIGRRARAVRTRNMVFMDLTLDVSKLSGWLNAFASCRVETRACKVRRGPGDERCVRAKAAQAVCREEGPTRGGTQGTNGTYPKHGVHGYDAGRVKAQRLVDRLRVLPSRKGGYGKQGEVRAGEGSSAYWWCTARAMRT